MIKILSVWSGEQRWVGQKRVIFIRGPFEWDQSCLWAQKCKKILFFSNSFISETKWLSHQKSSPKVQHMPGLIRFQQILPVDSQKPQNFKVVIERYKRFLTPNIIYISMTKKMIEYIEITLKHSTLENCSFRYIRLIAQNESFSCDLLNFLNRYGLFLMVPGKSSCPEGS